MILERIGEHLWIGAFLPVFLLCAGCLLLRFHFLPFRRFGLMLRVTLGGEEKGGTGLSASQAACTALSATVGTGNIIGTAQAIAMGGPGAVFWLWMSALLGMSVKYAEILLGQRFSGATGYIRRALGPIPAGIYAVIAVFSSLTMGNMAQMNGAVHAICTVFGTDGDGLRLAITLFLSLTAFISISGGLRRVGSASEKLVPFMTLGFLLATGSVLFVFRSRLGTVMRLILKSACKGSAVAGAAGGLGMRSALLWGLRRGCFSNEAGMGTAGNIHASVQSPEPCIHALWGVFEVFADTMILCTLTALTILCSGVRIPYGELPGAELLQSALALVYGQRFAGVLLSTALLLFGYTTVIGTAAVGLICASELGVEKGVRLYRIAFLICSLSGGLVSLECVWRLADLSNVLMSLPNLLALLVLSPSAGREVDAAFEEKGKTSLARRERKV